VQRLRSLRTIITVRTYQFPVKRFFSSPVAGPGAPPPISWTSPRTVVVQTHVAASYRPGVAVASPLSRADAYPLIHGRLDRIHSKRSAQTRPEALPRVIFVAMIAMPGVLKAMFRFERRRRPCCEFEMTSRHRFHRTTPGSVHALFRPQFALNRRSRSSIVGSFLSWLLFACLSFDVAS
jgi:hypothetical protein